jgi:cell division protein ZapA
MAAETDREQDTAVMGQVNVTINGKHYRMACDDGEEAHLAELADRLNGAIDQLRARFGEIGDQRLTVMAAITFADQAAETARRLAEAEAESVEQARADTAAAEDRRAQEQRIAEAIAAVASRIEAMAAKIAGADAN